MAAMLEATLLAGLNRLLQYADWARLRLAPYAGRHAVMLMAPLRLGFCVTDGGYFELAPETTNPDVTVRLPDGSALLLLQGLDHVMAQAHVEGNAEFATELSFVLRNLHWDIEEELSRFVGDIAAHRLMQGAGRLLDWQRQAAANLAGNVSEYLIHEGKTVIGNEEFAAFRDELVRLNAAITALEKRCSIQV